jgi:hypothetical protein
VSLAEKPPWFKCGGRCGPRGGVSVLTDPAPCTKGTMELANIPRLVQDLQGRDNYDSYKKFWDQYMEALLARGPKDLKRDRERYLAETLIYRNGRKPFFYGQEPQQLPQHRAVAADLAERENHRCAPRCRGLLLQ